jgi:hypothetical protein
VLLSVDTQKDKTPVERGQNLKRFTHAYIHAGFVSSNDNPGARIMYGSSVNLGLGMRKKYKISPLYSLGFDIQADFTDYKLKQSEDKILPDTVVNNIMGRMDYTSIGIGFYNRINFDTHRGNFMGTFIDIGIMGTWDFSVKEVSKNKQPDGTIVKTVVKNLPYTNSINSNVYARFGFSHLSLYGSYRLTDLFKKSYEFPELPRLIVGLEIGIY